MLTFLPFAFPTSTCSHLIIMIVKRVSDRKYKKAPPQHTSSCRAVPGLHHHASIQGISWIRLWTIWRNQELPRDGIRTRQHAYLSMVISRSHTSRSYVSLTQQRMTRCMMGRMSVSYESSMSHLSKQWSYKPRISPAWPSVSTHAYISQLRYSFLILFTAQ